MALHLTLAQIPTSQASEQAAQWFEVIRNWVVANPTKVAIGIAVLVGLIALRKLVRFVARQIRLSRPTVIHPSLAKYNVDRVEVQKRQRELSAGVVATSTSNRLAGYRLLRQVEAVFVQGFSSPEDALIALKATAVERGANAILNVKTEHTAAGRCTASGDAVLVAALTPAPGRISSPPPAPKTPKTD